MKKIILLIVILNFQLLTLNSFAQPVIQWERSLGDTAGNYGYSIFQAINGDFVMAGQAYSNSGNVTNYHGSGDVWIVRVDSTGTNIVFENCYGGSSYEYAVSVIETRDSGYAFVAYNLSNDGDLLNSNYHGSADYWVAKLNSAGDLQYSKCFGGSNIDNPEAIVQTYSGGYAAIGYTSSTDGDVTNLIGWTDYWLVVLNDTLGLKFAKCYGGTTDSYAYNFAQTRDSGFIIVGNTNAHDYDFAGADTLSGIGVIKTDSQGNRQWGKVYGEGIEAGFSVVQTLDGGYAIACLAAGSPLFAPGHGGLDYGVLKLDDTGAVQWAYSYGGSNDEEPSTIIQNPDGSYIVSGFSMSNDGEVSNNHGSYDYWIIKLDVNGHLIWEQSFGGSGGESMDSWGNTIIRSHDNGYAMVGTSGSSDGDVTGHLGPPNYPNIWAVKLAPDSTTGIDALQNNEGVRVYPNPVSETLTIRNYELGIRNELEITDVLGNIVYHQPLNNSTQSTITVSQWSNGMYFYNITNANASIRGKFVKE